MGVMLCIVMLITHPSQVSSVVRRTTSQQKGQTLVLLCYSPATNRPVKFPDQSGIRLMTREQRAATLCVHIKAT